MIQMALEDHATAQEKYLSIVKEEMKEEEKEEEEKEMKIMELLVYRKISCYLLNNRLSAVSARILALRPQICKDLLAALCKESCARKGSALSA